MLSGEGMPASGMAMEESFTRNEPGVTVYMKGVPFGKHARELARRHHPQGWLVVVRVCLGGEATWCRRHSLHGLVMHGCRPRNDWQCCLSVPGRTERPPPPLIFAHVPCHALISLQTINPSAPVERTLELNPSSWSEPRIPARGFVQHHRHHPLSGLGNGYSTRSPSQPISLFPSTFDPSRLKLRRMSRRKPLPRHSRLDVAARC